MKCVIFHINTNLLIIQQNINIFTQETLYPSVTSKRNQRSPSKKFFETSTFYHFFTIFKVNEVCNISSKCWLPNKLDNKTFLHKTTYTPPFFRTKNCALNHIIFWEHPLFTTFLLVFPVDELCYIWNKYHPPKNLAKHQCFYTRDFKSLLHF